MKHLITKDWISLTALAGFEQAGNTVELSDDARRAINECRSYLDNKLKSEEKPIYGINTGFGSLCDTLIGRESLEQLQRNLVMSHACGTGEEVPAEIVRLMLFLKIQGLSYGFSGVHIDTVERLIWHYNHDVLPVVYQQGSLGASGDLAPLAHLALPLIGLGEVRVKGEKMASADVLSKNGLKALTLKSKEGLALLNGTQFMSAYGTAICLEGQRLLKISDLVAACSIEAYDALRDPFRAEVHAVRPHAGQGEVATRIRNILVDSNRFAAPKKQVQDPYSFRCIPQVHGASVGALRHVAEIFETEINSVTDNPTLFPKDDAIISAGNFHGQPLAMALDYACIALAELASIAERRVYKLIAGHRGLPAFLVAEPGLNSGFMIPQYTAASIVSQNKQLCTPASVDTIDSSNGQEDHVSMGANAATKAWKVLKNTENVIAIELLNAMQALELRGVVGVASIVVALHGAFRQYTSFVSEDVEMHVRMRSALHFVQSLPIDRYIRE